MRKIKLVYIFFFLFFLVLSSNLKAWVDDTIRVAGEFNSWDTNKSTAGLYTNTLGGKEIWYRTFQATASGDEFLFENWAWGNKWADGVLTNNSVTTFVWHNSGGVNNTNKSTFVINDYYTFRFLDSGYANTSAALLHTTAFPVNITSVTDNSGGKVSITNSVRVRIVLSLAKSPEEKIYVRYSKDGWVSDNFVLSVASNTTVYTCSIPPTYEIGTVSYYVLSTTLDWANGNDLDNYPDLMTLRYNNNGGANYTYSVVGKREIDGNYADWVGTAGTDDNSSVVSSGEFIWKDFSYDVRNPGGGTGLAGSTNGYELTEFRITSDKYYLYFLIKLKDITSLNYPYIGITIDTNQINLSGQQWYGDFADLKVNTLSYWERELIFPYNNTVRFYNSSFASTSAGIMSRSTNYNTIEGAIRWIDLGITNSGKYRFTTMVAQDSNGFTKDFYGPDALDVITIQPGNTWNEISDTNINFYFDITFNNGIIVPDNNAPTSPSLISPGEITVSTNKPTFIWNKASDIDGNQIYFYNLQLSIDSNFATFYSNINVVVDTTNYYLSSVDLKSSTIYYWRVRGYDEYGMAGNWSTVSKFTTEGYPPFSPTNLSPADNSVADSLSPTLKWSFRDPDIGDTQSQYKIILGTNSSITPVIYSNITATSVTEHTITITLDKKKRYYWAVKTWDSAGKEGPYSITNSFITPLRAIDGDISDWSGIAPEEYNTAVISSNEWIWKDKINDERNDITGTINCDIKEARITFDSNYIYFAFTMQDITTSDDINLAIAIDTNLSGGMNWIGESSDTTIGSNYGLVSYNTHLPDIEVIVHNPVNGITKIELFTNNGTSWYAPPTAGDGTAYISVGNDVVEFKIARKDLGLLGKKIARFAVASFFHNVVWANSGDTTYDLTGSDAVDSISVPPYNNNDNYFSLSAWDEDISDGDIDFWFELKIKANGEITNIPPAKVTSPIPTVGSNDVSFTPTLKWSHSIDSDDNITGYLLELNSTTNLDDAVLYRIIVTNTNYTITSSLPDGITCYWRVRALDENGILSTNYDRWYFTTKFTETVPTPTTPVCSPYIDGEKDEIWGDTPLITSSNYKSPENYMKDLYLSNDPDYLYIGWSMGKDPWNESSSGYDKSAHFEWILETHLDAAGGSDDPFIGSTTTVGWSLKPDFWLAGWLKSGYTTFGKFYIYKYENSQWNATELVDGVDYAITTNNWAEVKLSLKELGLTLNSKLYILGLFRPAEDKVGVSDSIPYDAACSSYADTNANLTARTIYFIRYALIDVWHKPLVEDVAGLNTMRYPAYPTSSDKIKIQIGIYPYDGYDSAYLIYTTNNWATSFTNEYTLYKRSANNSYLLSEIGPFSKGKIIKYVNKVIQNNMITYNYGSDTTTSVTSNFAVAKANSYAFTIRNSSPSVPQVSVTPILLYTNDTLVASASNSVDIDGDSLIYQFVWYKNSTNNPIVNLTTNDYTAPYISKIVPSSNLSIGDIWFCRVRVFDYETNSGWATSKKVSVMLQKWSDILPERTNTSIVSNNEFIWLDKKNDVRDDTTVYNKENYDLLEFHSKADNEFLYFLFKFNLISDINKLGIALAISTNSNTGVTQIGDESDTSLKMKADINLLLHSIINGSPRIEVKYENNNWQLLSTTNGIFKIYKDANLCEAKIRRSVLGISNTTKPIYVSTAIFQNLSGRASDIDVSVDYPESDFLDTISILPFSTNIVYNDNSNNFTSYEDELFDNRVDYYFRLLFDNTGNISNHFPQDVSGYTPANNGIITTLTPTLQWNKSSDNDINDIVNSYRVEVSLYSNFNELIYKVDVNTNQFSINENLPYGYTNYYWRVYARDSMGSLSTVATESKFTVNISSPVAYTPNDLYNLDNFDNIQGIEDADGNVVWRWTPSNDPAGISNYYITVGTSAGASNILTNYKLGNVTVFTLKNLEKGNFYYAKLLAKNQSGIVGDYSGNSDGIYVDKFIVDGNSSDWISATYSPNTANLSNGIGIWEDAKDVRLAVTNLDLEQFQVSFDKYNLYMLFKFNTAWGFKDGSHFIQVALDVDDTSTVRAFIGQGNTSSDLNVTAEAKWEYLVKILSGLDTCTICDTTYGNWKSGVYKENQSAGVIEVMVPLAYIGGAENILGKSIKLSVAVFSNNSGNVQTIGSTTDPDAVDVISKVSGSTPTWSEISDNVLDFYLKADIDESGNITTFTGVTVDYTSPPTYPTVGAGSASWAQNGIFYNIFVDRFYNGDTGNDSVGDPGSYGGDFQGIIDKFDYIRNLGINVLALSPLTEYGYGGWGYGVDNWLEVESKYGGNNKLLELIKLAKENNMKVTMDWPGTAVGTSWPLKDGDRYKKWAGFYTSPYGGWPENTVGLAEVQQFFSDAMLMWASKGIDGMRCDYAKFQGNPADHGHQFWQYVRNHVKHYVPDLYWYGEVKGDDSGYEMKNYVNTGLELDGNFYFPLMWNIIPTMLDPSGTEDAATFSGNLDSYESEYGSYPIMVSLAETHDDVRMNCKSGRDSWRVRVTLGFLLTYSSAPFFIYGTENGAYGCDNNMDRYDEYSTTAAMNFGSMWGDSTDQTSFIKHLINGRKSFPGLRGSRASGSFKWLYTSGDWLIYERNYYNDAIVVLVNKGVSGANAPSFTTWASRTWRDWMNWSDYFTTDSDGNFTSSIYVNGHDVRVLVSREYGGGGFGATTISGNVGVEGVIIYVKDYVGGIVTREAKSDSSGNYTLANIVCKDTGGETRTVYFWYPGYSFTTNVTLYDSTPLTLNIDIFSHPDTTPPANVKGLVAKPGDKMVQLSWTPNSEDDILSYYVYRSESKNGPFTKIGEALKNVYMDDVFGDLNPHLENGKTYYYKVRAVDKNGNLGGFSDIVSATPYLLNVTFYVYVGESGYDVKNVYISGNTEKMNFWGNFGPLIEMENIGGGWYKKSFEFDPRMGIMYKYIIYDGNKYIWENNFSGTGSWWNNRFVNFYNQGDNKMVIINKWNTLGDAPPIRPENISVSPKNSKVVIGWNKSFETDLDFYYLYRATALSGPYSVIAKVDASANSYIDNEVSNGTTYYYYLQSQDIYGNKSVNSVTNYCTPGAGDSTPPDVPMNIIIYAYNTNSIIIKWDSNSEGDLAGYKIYRSTVSNGSYSLINKNLVEPCEVPFYIDNTITSGKKYFYTITAVDDSGNESGYSKTNSASLIKVYFKIDMGNIDTTDVSILGNTYPLNWTNGIKLEKIDNYRWGKIIPLLYNSKIQYKYAYNNLNIYENNFDTASGNREISITRTNLIIIEDDWESLPDTPESVWAFPMDGAVEIHWKANSTSEDLLGYNIYYSTNASYAFTTKVNDTPVEGTTLKIEGLKNNVKYYFVVRAVDSGYIELESLNSKVVDATPRRSVPVYFKVDATIKNNDYIFKIGNFKVRIK